MVSAGLGILECALVYKKIGNPCNRASVCYALDKEKKIKKDDKILIFPDNRIKGIVYSTYKYIVCTVYFNLLWDYFSDFCYVKCLATAIQKETKILALICIYMTTSFIQNLTLTIEVGTPTNTTKSLSIQKPDY